MSNVIFTEEVYEKVFLEEIKELGYRYVSSSDLVRTSYKSPILENIFKDALIRLNPQSRIEVIEEAMSNILHIDAGLLEARNERFFDYLQNGISISYYEEGEQKSDLLYLVDYEDVDNNDFLLTNQFYMTGSANKIPDIIIFINGLPMVVIELKSALAENADIWSAYRQIKNYQHDLDELFVYNAFNIISDFTQTKVGTITSNESWYKDWKSTDGNYKSTKTADYSTLLKGVLEKRRFLDIIQNFILFEHKEKETIKIMGQYHQYFAVHKAVDSTLEAIEKGDGRGGVFWHTQGSGKSLSMVFYTHLMMTKLDQPTFVIITDRNDLDDQLYGQFSRVQDFLRQRPIQAGSREHLKELLDERVSNGIFFTTMQKFAQADDSLTNRKDVIVIADEAHRSQYGLREKIESDGKVNQGMARLVRKSLPNATYIGFTGTPLTENDKDTQEVFGNYIDIYDMSQAVADGATKPIFYENRVINLNLDDKILEQIDKKYDDLAQEAREVDIEQSKQELSRMEALLGSKEAINTLVQDIITHYENNRQDLLTGKAMIVAYNREIAIKIYQKIMELRPEWKESVKLVITSSNDDPEEWKAYTSTKSDRIELAKDFKNPDGPIKIAIVVDMWLTGFDVPSLHTMYLYKPMKSHNLMQAIARVNRVFEDKEGGLIVDYIGIGRALKDAMSEYTLADQKIINNADIRDSAYPKFQEKLEVCRNVFFSSFNYSNIFTSDISNSELAKLIQEGLNYILQFKEEKRKEFAKEAYALKQAHTLCSSITTKDEQREAAYFEAIRISLNRLEASHTPYSKLEINQQINELLHQSIQSEGVINLFQDFEHGFSLFDPKFLDKLSKLKQRNLSIELLSKLLKDEIRLISRTNIIKAEDFSKRLQRIMERYRQGLVDNAESLDRFSGLASTLNEDYGEYSAEKLEETRKLLIDLAKETVDSKNEHERLGLTQAEMAFYNAIAKPENIQDFYTDEQLIQLTKELTEVLAKEMTEDWSLRESGRANVRRVIRRFLAKHKYPGDHAETIELVFKQAENWDEYRDDQA